MLSESGRCSIFDRSLRFWKINHLVDHLRGNVILKQMVDNSENRLDALFAALSDRTRRAILLALLEGDAKVKDLAVPFDMSMAAVSKHIQILTRAGLVSQHKVGREKWCRLEHDQFKPAALWIESYGLFLDESFDALERVLELQEDDNFLSLSSLDVLP